MRARIRNASKFTSRKTLARCLECTLSRGAHTGVYSVYMSSRMHRITHTPLLGFLLFTPQCRSHELHLHVNTCLLCVLRGSKSQTHSRAPPHVCPARLRLKRNTHFPGRFPLLFPLSLSISSGLLSAENKVFVCFISDHSSCVGMGSGSGALQREAWGALWAAVMGVLVNNGAVGGRFRSAVDSAAGAAAGC